MALDAGVVGGDVVHARGIQDIAACGMLDVLAPWAVALLATYVPLRYFLGLNVVVHRVATVACRPGWALHVVGRIKRLPPIGALRNEIRLPYVVGHVPLRGLRKIIVADFCKVALLPDAAIDQRNILFREFLADIVRGEIGNDGFGMLAGIADHVGHRSSFPVVVDLLVAFPASLRTNIVRGLCAAVCCDCSCGASPAMLRTNKTSFQAS